MVITPSWRTDITSECTFGMGHKINYWQMPRKRDQQSLCLHQSNWKWVKPRVDLPSLLNFLVITISNPYRFIGLGLYYRLVKNVLFECEVADTPFYIQGDEILTFRNSVYDKSWFNNKCNILKAIWLQYSKRFGWLCNIDHPWDCSLIDRLSDTKRKNRWLSVFDWYLIQCSDITDI